MNRSKMIVNVNVREKSVRWKPLCFGGGREGGGSRGQRYGMQLAEEQGGNRSGLLVKQEEVPGYMVECDCS